MPNVNAIRPDCQGEVNIIVDNEAGPVPGAEVSNRQALTVLPAHRELFLTVLDDLDARGQHLRH